MEIDQDAVRAAAPRRRAGSRSDRDAEVGLTAWGGQPTHRSVPGARPRPASQSPKMPSCCSS